MCHIKDDITVEGVYDLIYDLWNPKSPEGFWVATPHVDICEDTDHLINEDGYPDHLHCLFAIELPRSIGLFEDLMSRAADHLIAARTSLDDERLTDILGNQRLTGEITGRVFNNTWTVVADLAQLREEVMHILLDSLQGAIDKSSGKPADAHLADDFPVQVKVDLPINDVFPITDHRECSTMDLQRARVRWCNDHDVHYNVDTGESWEGDRIDWSPYRHAPENVTDVEDFGPLPGNNGFPPCMHCGEDAVYVMFHEGWWTACQTYWDANKDDRYSGLFHCEEHDAPEGHPIIWMRIVDR